MGGSREVYLKVRTGGEGGEKTLLVDWDAGKHLVSDADIRRALAIAQAVDDLPSTVGYRIADSEILATAKQIVLARADELLAAREQH